MEYAFSYVSRAVQSVLALFDRFIDGLGAWPYILFGIALAMLTGSILIPLLGKPFETKESNKRGRDNE